MFHTDGDPQALENKAISLARLVSELCCPQYGWYLFLFWKGPLHGTARAGHEIPNSAGGTSDRCQMSPDGPTIKKFQARSKLSIPIEMFNLARNFNIDISNSPQKKGRGGWLARNFILARNLQSRSKSRFFF